MVVSFVSCRPHPRQTSPGSSVSRLPYTLPSSVSCKPFVCHSYENCGRVHQQFSFWNKLAPSKPRGHSLHSALLKCFLFTFLRTLLHSSKTQLLCFQSIPHSCQQNTGGGGGGDELLTKDRSLSRHLHFFSSLPPLPMGNSIGSLGGLSAISSSCGKCRRSGSGTFTFDPFRMLMSCRALTTALP